MSKFKVGDKVQATGTAVQGVITKVINRGYYHVFFGQANGTYEVQEEAIEVYEGGIELVNKKVFTKRDLKTGMAVRLRNGDIGYLLLDTAVGDIIRYVQDGDTWDNLDSYTSDLLSVEVSCKAINPYDIMEVFSPQYAYTLIDTTLASPEYSIWTRTEQRPVREITVAQLEKELGYKLSIISDKD